MPAVRSVLVVGGGVAGLALAIGLQQGGVRAEIAEIKSDWTVLGVGFTLTGATLRALDAVGVRERCIEAALGYNEVVVLDAAGRKQAELPLRRLNGPLRPANVGIMRPLLHGILAEAAQAAGVTIRLGLSVASLDQPGNDVAVTFTDGTRGRYDLVVGADGFRSQIRALAFADAPAPVFTGQMVWRAMLDRPPDITAAMLFYGPKGKPGFIPLPQEMLLFYTQNVADRARLPEENLPQLLHAALEGYGGAMGDAREQLHRARSISYRYMDVLLMPPPWHRGRIVLIGDAAHIVSPHLSSGAGVAVEDAVVLAELLCRETQLAPALAGFMARRYERCRMVVENSLQLAEWERNPAAPGADPAGLMRRTLDALAQPI
jgi:2-polyprenyl-6-methoxyphenol hydroxylase-like FAD-dependent oxidoreductase